MATARIELPPKLVPLFAPPRGAFQYRGMHGGRASTKSYTAALMASVWGYAEPLRILAVREFHGSIKESFHVELKAAIEAHPFLADHYDVGIDYLRGKNGTEFIFRGLRNNINSIKSLAKIDLTVVEEAEDISEAGWLALEPTVFRQPKAEIWPIWNPRLDGSPVDMRFRKSCPDTASIVEMNWSDNPFLPKETNELRMREQSRLDPNTYAHIWEGAYLVNSDAQVMAGKWRVAEFEPQAHWEGPYQGGDFGYSQDPTAAVRCYIAGDVLHVSHGVVKRGLELDAIPATVADAVPGFADHVTRWDSASPGSISIVKRFGLPKSIGAEKWPGSVEDGIRYLRSFREIVIHPRCTGLIQEFRLYSYKVDPKTLDVLATIIDANNHGIDALRYAIAPMIKNRMAVSETTFATGWY